MAKYDVRQAFVFTWPDEGQLTEIMTLVDDGNLEVIVETILPLSAARQAQESSEQGHGRGKTVLSVI